MVELHNDIPSRLANVCRAHNLLLQQLGPSFDCSIGRIAFLIRRNIEADTHQLIIVCFYSITFRELQLNLVAIVSRQDALRHLSKIQREHLVAFSHFKFLSMTMTTTTVGGWVGKGEQILPTRQRTNEPHNDNWVLPLPLHRHLLEYNAER